MIPNMSNGQAKLSYDTLFAVAVKRLIDTGLLDLVAIHRAAMLAA